MTKKERLEELKSQAEAYRARYGEGSCCGPVPDRDNGHAYLYYYDFASSGEGEREADAAEEYDLDAGLWRYSDTVPESPYGWEHGPWGEWREMPADNGRAHLLRMARRTAESRRKQFGPGSVSGPEVSADGRTCTVTYYDVSHEHPGEGDCRRWDLFWVRNVHPEDANSVVEFDLDAGTCRERLLLDGADRWGEWADAFGPDGFLGRYQSDAEIMAAASEVAAMEDDPARACFSYYTHGETWQAEDMHLLEAAAIEMARRRAAIFAE